LTQHTIGGSPPTEERPFRTDLDGVTIRILGRDRHEDIGFSYALLRLHEAGAEAGVAILFIVGFLFSLAGSIPANTSTSSNRTFGLRCIRDGCLHFRRASRNGRTSRQPSSGGEHTDLEERFERRRDRPAHHHAGDHVP
jgi:hypothetical protein